MHCLFLEEKHLYISNIPFLSLILRTVLIREKTLF